MNEERIFMGKFAIILFRVIYVIAFLLSLVFWVDGTYLQGIAFGIVGIILVCLNIFFKSYLKKLKSKINDNNMDFENKRNEIMEDRKKVANEINKNFTVTVNDEKIKLSENDKKRIQKNCSIMEKKRLPYFIDMKLIPFDAIVKIKSKEEIAKEMVKEYCIAHKALNKIQGISDIQDTEFLTTVLKYQPDQELLKILSEISKGGVNDVALNELAYLFERVNVYMWILGLGDKPLSNKQCFVPGIAMKISKYKNIDDLISKCKTINYEEIMEYADLMTRYEWAMIELNGRGEKSKYINNDSVTEQKKAIDWVVSFDSNMLLK